MTIYYEITKLIGIIYLDGYYRHFLPLARN
jgi:hypothetical protein